jgi:hypothetical protein
MRTISILTALGLLALGPSNYTFAASAGGNGNGNGNGNGKDKKDQTIETVLAAAPLPEWPAQAAAFVRTTRAPDQENVALAAVRYAANLHPGSVTELIGALAGVVPGSAPLLAGSAAQLVPQEASNIQNAATSAAPRYAEQIARAVSGAVPGTPASAVNPSVPVNRPTVPPGLAGTSKPGLIRGNRPAVPPGLEEDGKPGRDPQRFRYGHP